MCPQLAKLYCQSTPEVNKQCPDMYQLLLETHLLTQALLHSDTIPVQKKDPWQT